MFVAVLPRTVKIHYPSSSGEPLSVSQARSYLECRSVGSWPPATLTWWKKGKFMGKAKEQVSDLLDFTPLKYILDELYFFSDTISYEFS